MKKTKIGQKVFPHREAVVVNGLCVEQPAYGGVFTVVRRFCVYGLPWCRRLAFLKRWKVLLSTLIQGFLLPAFKAADINPV